MSKTSIPTVVYDELAADAKRYRWLRDHCTAEENPQHTWILEAPGSDWDSAIDAAMKE